MLSGPIHLSISAARAGALFASPLQRSDEPSARQVRQAIATAIAAYGVRGCAARVAQAYGEHPETALIRMRWALTAAASASGGSQANQDPRRTADISTAQDGLHGVQPSPIGPSVTARRVTLREPRARMSVAADGR